MKIYLILTAESMQDGGTKIHLLKDLYFFKEEAFEKVKQIGQTACAVEFGETCSWTLEEIKQEENLLS